MGWRDINRERTGSAFKLLCILKLTILLAFETFRGRKSSQLHRVLSEYTIMAMHDDSAAMRWSYRWLNVWNGYRA